MTKLTLLRVLPIALAVFATSSCTNLEANIVPTNRVLVDLQVDRLRDSWTSADLALALQNERLLAFLDAQRENRDLGAVTTTELHELLFQRKFNSEDFLDGFAHPRDIPLTVNAYQALQAEITRRFLSGEVEVPANLRLKHPDIYAYVPRHFLKDYPLSQGSLRK